MGCFTLVYFVYGLVALAKSWSLERGFRAFRLTRQNTSLVGEVLDVDDGGVVGTDFDRALLISSILRAKLLLISILRKGEPMHRSAKQGFRF